MATTRKYEVHRDKDGTIHVTSKYRTAAWAHACFGPKGFAKWQQGLDPTALTEGKPCGCGAQPGTFRKASGQAYLEPKFREQVQAALFEAPAKAPTTKAPSKPTPAASKPKPKPKPAKKAAKKAAKKPAKKVAKKLPARKDGKSSSGGGAKAGALIRAMRDRQK